MISRRQFCKAAGAGAIACCLPTLSWALTDLSSVCSTPTQYILDLPMAKRLISSGLVPASEGKSVDLSIFTSATPSALSYLAQFRYSTAFLGIETLSADIARELAIWTDSDLYFPERMAVTPEALQLLAENKSAGLLFGKLGEIDPRTAEALVRREECSLMELSLDKLTLETANAIVENAARYSEIEIHLTSVVSTAALAALAAYKGQEMTVIFDTNQTPEMLAALGSSAEYVAFILPAKSLRGGAWGVAICSPDWYPSALENEYGQWSDNEGYTETRVWYVPRDVEMSVRINA